MFWLLISGDLPTQDSQFRARLSRRPFNWGANLLVSLTFLTLVQAMGASWTFWLYGICAVLAGLFSYWQVPETKGRTLEEIEAFWKTQTAAPLGAELAVDGASQLRT